MTRTDKRPLLSTAATHPLHPDLSCSRSSKNALAVFSAFPIGLAEAVLSVPLIDLLVDF